MRNKAEIFTKYFHLSLAAFCLVTTSCDNYFKNDYKDNSPTSGHLKVYYDEGLYLHLKNQVYTFESQYPNAHIHLVQSNDNDAVEALYRDSCEAIVISRPLNTKEKRAFASKQYDPKFSCLAYSGMAVVANQNSSLKQISPASVLALVNSVGADVLDSVGNPLHLRVLLDKNNSSLVQYLLDSLLHQKQFTGAVSVLKSSTETLDYVASNANAIALVDFAWLSDVDDSITKQYKKSLKTIGIDLGHGKVTYPSQSSFKLGDYPFTRKIYCYRKTGDFTLAKGFETYVAGPKGQMTFLKQGLLPFKQQERMVEVKFEPLNTNEMAR
jgi:ABC-type phosphate transport system substrate-binding protein